MNPIQERIQQIQGRIGEIEARFGGAQKPQAAAFNRVMQQAEQPQATQAAAPAAPGSIAALADAAARRHDVDPALVRAVMTAESGGDPQAKSPVGAMGLMQLMPGTAKMLGVERPFDPAENLAGGAKYLSDLTKRFGLEKGVAAYNAGPGAVEHYGGVPPYRETQHYVDKVMDLYSQFKAQPGAGAFDQRR